MNEICLNELSEPKTCDRLRQIAEGISPGKGIPISEVASELNLNPTSIRTHAKALGCYCVVNIKGKLVGFVIPPTK